MRRWWEALARWWTNGAAEGLLNWLWLLVLPLASAVALALGRALFSRLDPFGTTLPILAVAGAVAGLVVLIDRSIRPAEEYDPAAAAEVVEDELEPITAEEAVAPEELLEPKEATAKAIVDLAAKAYADEFDKAKALDAKSSAIVAFTGAVMLFTAGVVTKPPDNLSQATDAQRAIETWWSTIALGFFFAALSFLYLALRVRKYEEIDLSQWARYSEMARPTVEIYVEIASSYENHVEHNHNLNALKAQRQEWGLRSLVFGVGLVVALLAWLPWKWLPWA